MVKEEMITCPRCGELMRKSQRNCLKCGQLNYENVDNKYMEKYTSKSKNGEGTYVIGQGTMNNRGKLSIFNNSRPIEKLADNTGSLTVCAVFNILFFIAVLVLIFLYGLSINGDMKAVLLSEKFSYFIIIYSLLFIWGYSFQLLFMKANRRWWKALIPVYNLYVLYDIVLFKGWVFFLTFIPVIGVFVLLYMFYRLGKSFGKNPWITLILGPIMIPFIAFSYLGGYNGIIYVNEAEKSKYTEKLFKWNKFILTLVFICIFSGVASIIYNNSDWFIYKFKQIKTRTFIKDAEYIMKDAKESIKNDRYFCSNNLTIDEQDIYYIQFDNVGNYFYSDKLNDSSLSREYYRGYIKVVNHDNKSDYYIALNNNVYGIDETKDNMIRKVYAEKGKSVEIPEGSVICKK